MECNQLKVSDTVSIGEPTSEYLGITEYKNSAIGHLIALENKSAMEYYLEEMIQGTRMKRNAYIALVSSGIHTETVEQLVRSVCRAVVLGDFGNEMRTTPKIHALVAIPYIRFELHLRFAWCMTRLTMGEYDSDKRKRSQEEKVLMMTSLRDPMICDGVAVACATRRNALCFVRFMLEKMSSPALNTCAKMMGEDGDLAKTLLLQALLDTHRSTPLRVKMKEPLELEPLKKIE